MPHQVQGLSWPSLAVMEVRRRTPYVYDHTDNETFSDRIKKVDTFEKLPQECVNRTSSGGGGKTRQLILFLASILTFVVIIVLIFAELSQFRNPDVAFNYSVDSSIEG